MSAQLDETDRASSRRLPPPLGGRRLRHRIRAQLTWSGLYAAASYVRGALWVVPLVAIALVMVLAPLLRVLDGWLDWQLTALDVEGAQALFQTVTTLTLSFLVFTFGSLLVAIQIAGGQLTPRIIATALLRDNVVRYSVGLYVFTLVFAVTSLNRLHGHVFHLVTLSVIVLGVLCMSNFLFLIDYAARLLRPVSVCARIGDTGVEVIDQMYPEPCGEPEDDYGPTTHGPHAREVVHMGASRVVVAVDVPTLVAEARRLGGVIELAPQVGDFLAYGEVIFRLHGGAAAVADHTLEASVALGAERTLEQDPAFALRILVDIALKALSPAINDPTTGVLAIDQVHRLLRYVGQRRLRADAIRDADGEARLIVRTPDWEDFVQLSCREIRACGANNLQIARRMMAMLEDLLRLLPPARHPALELERTLLDRAFVAAYPFPEDLALARAADIQGLGGSRREATRVRA
ncbi:MAG TPA: DUF2254 domain-containing protein [Usitatibacter sp.]|jgi:uncharacterized membrane protein|nr:DUF2254 domain-containing protein [Usitatibacter sp.]